MVYWSLEEGLIAVAVDMMVVVGSRMVWDMCSEDVASVRYECCCCRRYWVKCMDLDKACRW